MGCQPTSTKLDQPGALSKNSLTFAGAQPPVSSSQHAGESNDRSGRRAPETGQALPPLLGDHPSTMTRGARPHSPAEHRQEPLVTGGVGQATAPLEAVHWSRKDHFSGCFLRAVFRRGTRSLDGFWSIRRVPGALGVHLHFRCPTHPHTFGSRCQDVASEPSLVDTGTSTSPARDVRGGITAKRGRLLYQAQVISTTLPATPGTLHGGAIRACPPHKICPRFQGTHWGQHRNCGKKALLTSSPRLPK